MTTYQSDEQMLSQMQKGSQKAFNEFYTTVSSKSISFIQNRFGFDFETAEDIFHDAFIIFHQKVKSGVLCAPLKSKLSTYFLGIARNLALKTRERSMSFSSEIPDFAVNPEIDQIHENAHNTLLVNNLLKEINENQKNLISLFYYKEYTPRMVADEMGVEKEGTIRKRKFDTLKKMRTIVNENKMVA